jgi:hypothetical protein
MKRLLVSMLKMSYLNKSAINMSDYIEEDEEL